MIRPVEKHDPLLSPSWAEERRTNKQVDFDSNVVMDQTNATTSNSTPQGANDKSNTETYNAGWGFLAAKAAYTTSSSGRRSTWLLNPGASHHFSNN
ncbi:hypothetical protein VTN49DRAFT_2641 [Thermomyces lanuginosus]|uniref:uncharacterized protein n=1 Tax=Thermomyces lanuginosus TaxID=5541 RepID=UPI0037420D03